MILDAAAFSDVEDGKSKGAKQAIGSFLEFLEQKLGARVVFDTFNFSYGKPQLASCFTLAKKMIAAGLITGVFPVRQLPDEPRLKMWMCNKDFKRDLQTGGASLDDEKGALMSALAEALERQIWRQDDYFAKPIYASEAEMQEKRIAHVALESFAAYSAAQRNIQKKWQFNDETKFLWVRGTSLIDGKFMYVPAQTVSGKYGFTNHNAQEPIIRVRTTNGLATWPTQTGARLAGALELVERDAYMVMWLNQLTLPRLDISSLFPKHPSLAKFVHDLERYRFRIHCIPLLTDAPTHAICTVIEDVSGKGPRFTVGLKAHRSLAAAIEKSATEALRARYGVRLGTHGVEKLSGAQEVGHYERVVYWAREENAKKLEFLIQGEIKTIEPKAWDNDSENSHLARIVEWLQKNNMEAVSVPLTHSKKNVSKLHIEMVVIPALHALHLFERDIAFGGERWQTIPKLFGMKPRAEIFTAEPHPFA